MRWALYNLTTTTQPGGVEMSVWALGRELAARGHEVTVYGGLSDRPLPAGSEALTVLTFPFRPREAFPDLGSRFRKLMERVSFARAALPELERRGCDRLMVFKSFDLAPALLARRACGAKAGFLSGGTESYPGLAWLARRLDYLACVSAFNAGQIGRLVGRAPQVNHLGVDNAIFRPAQPDPGLAAAAGIESGDEVLVSAVRLVALKGVQRAIRALAVLAPARPGLKYLVAGEGPYRPELERLVAKLGLEPRVRLLGFVPQDRLAGFYALGRLAVFPSTGEESLGLSIAEAMACGLPVLASRLGGVPEVVGDDGALVPPGDDQALTGAIASLLDDPGRRADLAQRGRARVLSEFSWSACVDRLERGLA
jgi:glycosyltransferase involved in cell wall biosynthesis